MVWRKHVGFEIMHTGWPGHFCHPWFPLVFDISVFGPSMINKSQFGHHLSQAGNASLWSSSCHTAHLIVTGAMAEEIHLKVLWWGYWSRGVWLRVKWKTTSHGAKFWDETVRNSSSGIKMPDFAVYWLWDIRWLTTSIVSISENKKKYSTYLVSCCKGLN